MDLMVLERKAMSAEEFLLLKVALLRFPIILSLKMQQMLVWAAASVVALMLPP